MVGIYLVLMAIGLVIIAVGFIVKRTGKTSFIAGYNEIFVPKNEKKLAGQIGIVLVLSVWRLYASRSSINFLMGLKVTILQC